MARPNSDTPAVSPPHDVWTEEAVIAAVLLDESAYWRVEPIVRPQDFFREEHEWIFRAYERLAERAEFITLETVAHELERTKHGLQDASTQLDGIGGPLALTALVSRHFAAEGVEAHARIVARDAKYRRMIQAAGQIAQIAYEGGPDIDRAMSAATGLINGIQADTPAMGTLTAEQVVQKLLQLDVAGSGRVRAITSGYPTLDRKIQGYAPGEVIAIGANTTVGKTAFAVGAAHRQALAGVRVGYVPVEGNRDVLTHRMAAALAGFNLKDAKPGGQWGAESLRRRYSEALEQVSLLDLWWPDRYIDRVTDICAWISVQVHQVGLQVAYIDHIDVVRSERDRDSRASEIADVMRMIQNTARRENVAIVFLSQINRAAARKGKMPTMRDLREAGAKEELSQVVLMMHRQTGSAQTAGMPAFHVSVEKCTEGPVGELRIDDDAYNPQGRPAFRFNPRTSGVEDLTETPLAIER